MLVQQATQLLWLTPCLKQKLGLLKTATCRVRL